MKESVFWLFLSICALALSLGCAFRAGRVMGRAEQPQLLSMNKDLMQHRKALQGQVAAVRDAVSEVAHDSRTHGHTRLQLERVLEKCQTRGSTES
jgi:hypothetical protein